MCGRRWADSLPPERADAGDSRAFTDDRASTSTSLESLNALLPPSSLAINPWKLDDKSGAAIRGRLPLLYLRLLATGCRCPRARNKAAVESERALLVCS